MSFGGDERAVSVVVGAVLMLGILVSALALYQANVVPDQNAKVEFEHNERVESDLIELRDAIGDADRDRHPRSVSIQLGTQYDSRTMAINPPQPSGTIETRDPAGGTIEISEGGDHVGSFETKHVVYEPDYNEYRDPPVTSIEHSLLFNRFDEANVTRQEPTLFDGERFLLALVDGEVSETTTGATSVPLERLEGPRVRSFDEDVTVTLPTSVPDLWVDAADGRDGVTVSPGTDSVVLTLDSDEFSELRLVRVGIGSDFGPDQLDGFGQPVDGAGGSATFALDWETNGATTSAGDVDRFDVTVTDAGTGDPIAGTGVDFSTRNDGVVDIRHSQSDDRTDASGVATVEVEARNNGTTSVYAAAGDGADELEITVGDGSGGSTFGLSNFTAPASAAPDEMIDVSVDVTNTGDETATATVEYVFDGSVVDTATIELASGETGGVAFTYRVPGTEGEYDHRARTDGDSTATATISVESAAKPVGFEASSVSTDDTVQRFTFDSTDLGNSDEATIELSDPQANGQVDYSGGQVAVTTGQNVDYVVYDESTDEIRYSHQGNGNGELTIEISGIEVVGDPGASFDVGYSDTTGNEDGDTVTIEQGAPRLEALEATANVDGTTWYWDYTNSVTFEWTVDDAFDVDAVELRVYDDPDPNSGSVIGTGTESASSGTTTVSLDSNQYDTVGVQVVVSGPGGDRCLVADGGVDVGETVSLAGDDFVSC